MGLYYKEVNKSLLESGKITIPDDKINLLVDISNWAVGHSESVELKFNNKIYKGKIAYKPRNAKNKKGRPYYQLSYSVKLAKALRKEFFHKFVDIGTERTSNIKNNNCHITIDMINGEVLQIKSQEDGSFELIMQTQFDNLFQQTIEWNILDLMENMLSRKKQIILYGPPGTGKTYNAEKVCLELSSRNIYKKSYDKLSDTDKEAIIGDGRNSGTVRICCFHPSYGYEDFIEGIKPNSVNGQMAFELEDGIFKKLCIDASKEPGKKFFLIIDEINRGDISRIFGELIMLIEAGKRGKNLILPLSKELFYVPANVYIVGTMNTADRSIALLDLALRRRFGFLELMPEYSFFKDIIFDGLSLDEWLKRLNKRICDNLGKDARNLQIGHSYFLENEKSITGSEKFKRIIKDDVIPLIEEYCYGDYSLMAKILGDGIIDVKNQLVRYELFTTSDTANMINALLSPCPELRASTEKERDDIDVLDEEYIEGDDNES